MQCSGRIKISNVMIVIKFFVTGQPAEVKNLDFVSANSCPPIYNPSHEFYNYISNKITFLGEGYMVSPEVIAQVQSLLDGEVPLLENAVRELAQHVIQKGEEEIVFFSCNWSCKFENSRKMRTTKPALQRLPA
jgi:hypothetical protein